MNRFAIHSSPRHYTTRLTLAVLLAFGVAGGPVFGATTFDTLTGASPFDILTTSCHTTDRVHPLTANPTNVPSGSSGTILFTCSGDAAFIVQKPGLATPHFTLPAGYTALTIVVHVPGVTSCSPRSVLVSGEPFSFDERRGFDYCALYSDAPTTGLVSFTLTWSRSLPQE